MSENKQASRSREWIYEALIKIMENKMFNDITIGEITKKAGVARLTFYRNYNSKEDIILRKTRKIYNDLMVELETISLHENAIYNSIHKIIFVFNKYEHLFELLLKNGLDYLIMQSFESEISNILKKIFRVNTSEKYRVKFYEGALFAIAVEWVKNSRKESVNEMTNIIFDLVSV